MADAARNSARIQELEEYAQYRSLPGQSIKLTARREELSLPAPAERLAYAG